jgi:predicted DNA-binding protein with PD1-like motif
VIVSAIGSAKEVVYRDLLAGVKIPLEPSKTNELRMMGPYEILSLEGNVFPMDNELVVHLHALLGTENGSVCGGHVMQAKVLSTLELILVEIKKASSYRTKSAITGLNELLMD